MFSLSRRRFLQQSCKVSLVLAGTSTWGPAAIRGPAPKRPNLLIVFPDQMRAQAQGFRNEDPVVTPHLDRFAGESLVLDQAVSNYPVCSPFRAMLMTGMYPHRNGVISNCTSHSAPFGVQLKQTDRCWSDVLHDRGYSLGYIGKWHLDSPHAPYIDCKNNRGATKWNEYCPPPRRHGFDFWYAYGTYDYHLNPLYWKTDAPRDGFHFADQWGPEHEADLAIQYIRNEGGAFRDANKPFALTVSMNPPHTPYNQFPKKYLAPYADKKPEDLLVRPNVDKSGKTKMSRLALEQTKNYFANVTGVDEQFGRIVSALDEAGLGEDTLVLFTADHGNCLGTHNQATKNNLYEESMRIPMMLRWSGTIPACRSDLLLSIPDLYPTLLDLMGLGTAVPERVQGVSHARYVQTGQGPQPTSQPYIRIIYERPDCGQRGVRTSRYKLVLTRNRREDPLKTQLFDLRDDPYELKDIAAKSSSVVEVLMREELIPWLQRNDDPFRKHLASM